MMEAKVAVTKTELLDLLEFLEGSLPDSCSLHTQLVFHMKSNIPGDVFYFLRHPSDGTYLAIVGLMLYNRLDSNNKLQKSWMINGWATDPVYLDQVYRAIDVIDWSKDYVRMFHQEHEPSPNMRGFLTERNRGNTLDVLPMNLYVISQTWAVNIEMNSPEDVYLKPLEPCHAAQVHDKWRGKDTASPDCILDVIVHLPSAGVFRKNDHQLMAWAVCHPPSGGVSHLYTIEGHRGKGYAVLAVQYLCKQLACRGLVPYATIFTGNEPSLKLFSKMGFTYLGNSHFLIV